MMNYRLKVMSMTSCDLFFGENDPPIVTSWPHLHQHINNDVGGNDGEEEDDNDGDDDDGNDGEEEDDNDGDDDDDDGNDGDGHLSIGINVGQKSSSREKCRHQGNAREDVLIISIIPPNDDDDDDYLPVEDKEDGEGPLKTDARHICPRHTSWSDLKCHISLIIDHHHHNHFDRTSASVLGAWC